MSSASLAIVLSFLACACSSDADADPPRQDPSCGTRDQKEAAFEEVASRCGIGQNDLEIVDGAPTLSASAIARVCDDEPACDTAVEGYAAVYEGCHPDDDPENAALAQLLAELAAGAGCPS